MTYKIVKNGNQFEIHELATEHLISTYESHDEASKFYKALKKGRAFNGWTPGFFLVSVKDMIK